MTQNQKKTICESSPKKLMGVLMVITFTICGSSTFFGTAQFVVPDYPNFIHQDQEINRFYRLFKRDCFGVHFQSIKHQFTEDAPATVADYFASVGIPVRDSSVHSINSYRDTEIWRSNFYYNYSNFISVVEIKEPNETSIFYQNDLYILLFSSGPNSLECRALN